MEIKAHVFIFFDICSFVCPLYLNGALITEIKTEGITVEKKSIERLL